MTEKLKDLMDDASDLAFEPVDVDAVVRAGDRTVRRRRGVTGLATLATAAVVGGVAYVGLSGDDGTEQTPVVSRGDASVSYTLGSTLHTETGQWDLGHPVSAYVTTADGVVFADPQGRVWAEGRGEPLGRTDATRPRLVADDEGTLVGWIDTSGERPAYVVHDLASSETTRFDEENSSDMDLLGPDSRNPAEFYAIDGRTAYWLDARGAVATDIDSGEARVVSARADFDTILAVEDGTWATRSVGQGAEAGKVRIVDQDGESLVIDAYASTAVFSPDARFISVDADEPKVFDTRTGGQVDMDIDGRVFGAAYQWLDDRTVAMISARTESSPPELLRCTVPAGSCVVAFADIGSFEDLSDGSFALPVGESLAAQ